MGNKKKNKGNNDNKKLKQDDQNVSQEAGEIYKSTPVKTGQKRPCDEVSGMDSTFDVSLVRECERTNAGSISMILEMLQTLQKDVSDIKCSLKTVESDMEIIKKSVDHLGSRCAVIEANAIKTDDEVGKLTDKTHAQEVIINELCTQVALLKNQSMLVQNTDKKNNVLFWNVKPGPSEDTESTVKRVLVDGLGIPASDIPSFSVVNVTDKFVKIKTAEYQGRFAIMSNAKKLKGKDLGFGKPVFVSDDVSKEVRLIRRDLLEKRKILQGRGIQCWVPPVVPPVLCIRENGEVKKLGWYEAMKSAC